MVTGDSGLTAAEIAHRVGIGSAAIRIVAGEQLDAPNDPELDSLLSQLVEQFLDSESSVMGKTGVENDSSSDPDTNCRGITRSEAATEKLWSV